MSTTVKINLSTMVKVNSSESIPWSNVPQDDLLKDYNYYYSKLSSLTSAQKTKVIESAKVYATLKCGTYYKYPYIGPPYFLYTDYVNFQVFHVNEVWDANTITYANRPSDDKKPESQYGMRNADVSIRDYDADVYTLCNGEYNFTYSIETSKLNLKDLRKCFDYGFFFNWFKEYDTTSTHYDQSYPYVITKGTNAPYFELVLSDNTNSLSISSCSPTSGFRAKYSANTYNWSTKVNSLSIEDPTISHAYFRYRANSSSQYTQIDCGSALSYTMPANTISTDSFQWQVSIVDSNGNTSTSDWFTINTQEATSTATIVSPKNITIDGSDINRFEWLHNISTGTAQTKADLQYSSDSGSTWTQFATAIGSATYSNIAADTFNAGTYLWRVRTYNTDDVAGSWSEVKPFTVIAKPHVYAVTSEQNPKPKVSWQGEGQQAFRVYIDNVFDSGVVFGTADYYTLPIYLDDGTYTVNVIVQNNYGLWSNTGTAPINVTNTPGTSMTLVPVYEGDGLKLMWTEVLSYAYYVVYRDNVPIAKIRTNEFKDYTALGQHSYFIRGIYASSKFYGLSNVLEADTSIGQLMITDLESEISLSIEQNDSSFAELSITDSVNNTSVYISAADYPINEVSHFKNKSIRFDCAFVKNNESALSFRNMLGKLVCVKTPSGTSIVGNLLAQNRIENYFYEKYSCTLVQTHYEEGIQL